MHRLISTFSVLAMATLSLTAFRTASEPATRYLFTADSKVWIEGTSTLHDYSCGASEVVGFTELKRNPQFAIEATQVTIPVAQLDCNNNRMNRLMQDALKASAHPTITFSLVSATPAAGAASGDQVFNVEGWLTVAGVTRSIKMAVEAKPAAGGSFRFQGKHELLMSDFNVDRPTAMLGTIRTNDKVVVHFDAVAQPM